MKKVLLIANYSLNKGGIQTVIMDIVRSLYNRFTFDIVLFTEEKGYFEEEFLSYGGTIYRVPYYCGNNRFRKRIDYYLRAPYLYYRTKKILKAKTDYDVLHCNNGFEGAIFLKLADKFHIPVRIMHSHAIPVKYNIVREMLNKYYLKAIMKYSTNTIGCSTAVCNEFFGEKCISSVITNPYDSDSFTFAHGPNNNSILVLTQVGYFSENKNQLFTIKLVKALTDMNIEVCLNLIGFDEGEYYQKIKNLIKLLHLETKVCFYPQNANIPAILKTTNALICPSKKEGFGIVLLEAQACGVKCYASDSIPEDANVGGVTYLKLSEGEHLWANVIAKDYLNKRLQHTEYDCSRFKLEVISEKYAELYENNGDQL